MPNGLFIGGVYVQPKRGEYFTRVSPVTGLDIDEFSIANVEDVDLAVESAKSAFVSLSGMNPADRIPLLDNVARILQERADEIAAADAQETGKPFADCQFDIPAAVNIIKYFAGAVDKVCGVTLPVQNGFTTYTKRVPWGVVGAIVPWNYPIFNAVSKVAPILAMGNACLLKPAEEASRSALILGEVVDAAGFPAGSLNVLTGPGEVTGAALAQHMGIDKISFTGSTQTGREIMRASANSNLKAMTLELGGKSPIIIFDDADIDSAVDAAAFSTFSNNGQTCTATTRLLVQRNIASAVEAKLAAKARQVSVGDPNAAGTHTGAIVSPAQFERVKAYINAGISEGAQLLAGTVPSAEQLEYGFYIEPIIFTKVSTAMKIAQEEIFGPVATIIPFDTEEEAVRIANDTVYGLAASVWTDSASRLHRVSEAIDSGLIWANCVFVENPAASVGGFKQSGFGKEYGMQAANEYTREKTIWISHNPSPFGWP